MRVGALIVVLCACAPSERGLTGSFDRASVEISVRDAMASYAAALEALDSARILGHYVAGPEFRLVTDGFSNSYQDMQRTIGNLPRVLRKEEVHWDTLVVNALGPDAGLVYAPFRRIDTDTAGQVTRIRGVATWLWVRRDGQWRSVYGHADHYPDTTAMQ